eukprot:8731684-Pyramimonas_sp.AAC.1
MNPFPWLSWGQLPAQGGCVASAPSGAHTHDDSLPVHLNRVITFGGSGSLSCAPGKRRSL